MPVDFIQVGGPCAAVDLEDLKRGFNESQRSCSSARVVVINRPSLGTWCSELEAIVVIWVKDESGNYARFYNTERNKSVYLKSLILAVGKVEGLNELQAAAVAENVRRSLGALLNGNGVGFPWMRGAIANSVVLGAERAIPGLGVHDASQFNYKVLSDLGLESRQNFSGVPAWRKPRRESTVEADVVVLCIGELIGLLEEEEWGVLTRDKLQAIDRRANQRNKFKEQIGEVPVVIRGRPGTGKTTALFGLIHERAKKGEHSSFMTFNRNLLYDVIHVWKLNKGSRDPRALLSATTLFTGIKSLIEASKLNEYLSGRLVIDAFRSLHERVDWMYGRGEKDVNFLFSQREKIKVKYPRWTQFKKYADDRMSDAYLQEINELGGQSDYAMEKRPVRHTYEEFRRKSMIKSLLTNGLTSMMLARYEAVLSEFILVFSEAGRDELEKRIWEWTSSLTEEEKEWLREAGKSLPSEARHEPEIRSYGWLETGQMGKWVGSMPTSVFEFRFPFCFVDEAQDCLRVERDVIYHVYGPSSVVLVDGGGEQVVRDHGLQCDWNLWVREWGKPAEKVGLTRPNLRGVNRRSKRGLLHFVNAFCEASGMGGSDMESAIDSMDSGRIVLDFRTGLPWSERLIPVVRTANERGQLHGCVASEAVLIFDADDEDHGSRSTEDKWTRDGVMVREETKTGWSRREEFEDILRDKGEGVEDLGPVSIWDGTPRDKSRIAPQGPDQFRVCLYDSCRGLESWGVVCLGFGRYVSRLQSAKVAVAGIRDLVTTEEDQRRNYVANWIHMVLTRAMDNIYIDCSELDPTWRSWFEDYAAQGHPWVTGLHD